MTQSIRYAQAKKITLIGAVVNAFLGCIKLIGGMYYHSHALVADGIHSFSDLLIDAMVLIASKFGSQEADALHPYGHQRIETATTLLLAMLLILTGAGIAWDSIHEMLQHSVTAPRQAALPIAVFSIVTNEILFHYTLRVGKRIQSQLLIANAWHHRSDAAASLVVAIGLIGSLAGYHALDPVAAVVIGGMIIHMGLQYGWNSVRELVDTGVDAQQIAEIERVIREVPGVVKVHQLRNRMMGHDLFIDVHVLVSPCISVSEGHYIAQHVHQKLSQEIKQVKDVTVHIDPEDDEIVSPSLDLPNRQELEQLFFKPLAHDFAEIKSWVLHYLDGKLHIQIIIDQALSSTLLKRIKNDFSQQPKIASWCFLHTSSLIPSHDDKLSDDMMSSKATSQPEKKTHIDRPLEK